jgi:hypothetical protein
MASKTEKPQPPKVDVPDTQKPDRKRLNLDLAPTAYTLLQKLATETDKNMADVLRTGLALYGIAHDANSRGQGLGIIEGDKVIKEIIIT